MPASDTIFDRTSALARELGAINLGQGFPDLPEPPELLEAAQRALVGKSNQYPPMRGLPELRRAVCDYYRREQGLELHEEQVIVTSGATEALAAAILAFVRPGDEAVLLQPFYDAYLPLVERAGGTVRTVSLEPPRWTVPLDGSRSISRIATLSGPTWILRLPLMGPVVTPISRGEFTSAMGRSLVDGVGALTALPSARANGFRFDGSGDANRPSQPSGSPGMQAP